MFLAFLFGRDRRSLREVIEHQGRQTREVLKAMALDIQQTTARLRIVGERLTKVFGEVSNAKSQISALTGEVAALREVIAGLPGTIPQEQLDALETALSSVEQRTGAVDAALPDLPEEGASPVEVGSPEDAGSPEAGSPVDTGSPADESAASPAPSGPPFA